MVFTIAISYLNSTVLLQLFYKIKVINSSRSLVRVALCN